MTEKLLPRIPRRYAGLPFLPALPSRPSHLPFSPALSALPFPPESSPAYRDSRRWMCVVRVEVAAGCLQGATSWWR
ncbi:hypothetical protein E2C01_070131 [Portunus trituberculatus]|uniref:Uncharacterized protein n=1 Tax=Portunus trituberculatus TaxID=210409 RepID=A0A5B7I2Q7_PORTR|nr:hypothetical protein [Portunus trituberculatus]